MAFGLGTLKLSPDAFWRSTPLEISAALKVHSNAAASPPTRSQFEALMMRFPDHSQNKGNLDE